MIYIHTYHALTVIFTRKRSDKGHLKPHISQPWFPKSDVGSCAESVIRLFPLWFYYHG